MGLLDLKTDLKSLKYGKDTPGGGSSGEPYIQTDINKIDSGFNKLRLTKFDDGLIRGGAVGALNASVVDTLRIGKFLKDLPQGPLFIAKQVGLQFSNPKLETKKIALSQGSGILNFIGNLANKVSSNFGPTRIYNLGINTLAQVPVNAFGKHFNRHGLTPVQDDSTKYFAVVSDNNKSNQNVDKPSNRLVELKSKLLNKPYNNITQSRTFGLLNTLTSSIGSIFGFSNPLKSLTANQLTIDDYIGGPNSVYGVGRTVIRRYDYTDAKDQNKTQFQKERGIVDYGKTLGLSNLYFTGQSTIIPLFSGILPSLRLNVDRIKDVNGSNNIDLSNPTNKPSQIDQNVINYNPGSTITQKYAKLRETIDKLPSTTPKIIPFSTSTSNKIGFGPFQNKLFKPESNSGLDRTPSTPFRYYGKAKSSPDGSQLVYDNSNTYSRIDSDILTVGFTIIDPFTSNEDKIFLSAYMKGFKEDFNATWNDINYAGRAESFYVYNKFKRTVSFNLQIPCFNRKELFEKHRALGQLASTTAGSYNSQGLLGGVLIKLNVGNYIIGEYSILNSINYSIPDDASWDVTPEGRLAMLVDTSFNFTIIHKDLPQYKQNQGFFNYLPNTYDGYILKNNRSEREQTNINETFVPNNYKDIDNLVSDASISEFIRNYPSTPQIEFKPTVSRTINTPDKLPQIDLRTGKTSNI
jgi:hypothetical protein